MKRFTSLLFVAFSLCAVTSQAQTSGPAKELAVSCVEKFKANDMDGAFADCGKAIETDPRSTDAYVIRGIIFLKCPPTGRRLSNSGLRRRSGSARARSERVDD